MISFVISNIWAFIAIAVAVALAIWAIAAGAKFFLRGDEAYEGLHVFRERPLDPEDATTVAIFHGMHDPMACSDPPEVSCSDAACPVHGDEWHPLDDWAVIDALSVPRPDAADSRATNPADAPGRAGLGPGRLTSVVMEWRPVYWTESLIVGWWRRRNVRRGGMGAQGEPATGPYPPEANTAPPRTPGTSLLLARDHPPRFWTTGMQREADRIGALLTRADSILAGAA